MGIHTVQCDIPCKTLSRVEYTIVDDVDNSLDVLDDIFGDALVALEELTIIKNNVEGTDHQ